MARQYRDNLTCQFYDVENHLCGVYEQRPMLCQLYGSVKGMQCPHVSGLVQIVDDYSAKERLRKEYESGAKVLSTEFNWKQAL